MTARAFSAILRHIPKYVAADALGELFFALTDPTRRAIVERLARSPASVSDLARPFNVALPTIVQHLGVLESAHLVTSTKVGRVRTYQLAPEALTPAANWIGKQRLPAERQLDRLAAYLTRQTQKEHTEP